MRCVPLLLLVVLAPAGAQQAPDLMRILRGIERRYNNARTLEVRFEQTYRARGVRTESGTLFLRKPGRMRWEYRVPEGKLFLSDGKHFYFYSPAANRVEKMSVKESYDLRAPLAFLLGRLDFSRDFNRYEVGPDGDSVRVRAFPRSDRVPYTYVEFIVDSLHRIRRLVIAGQDSSTMEFHFENERLNPPLSDGLFVFRMPEGAELVDVSESR